MVIICIIRGNDLAVMIWPLLALIIYIRKLSFIFQCIALHVDVLKKLGYVSLRKQFISQVLYSNKSTLLYNFLWEDKPFSFMIHMHIYR